MKHTAAHPNPAACDWRAFAAAGAATLAAATHADAAIIYTDPTTKPTAALPGPAPYGSGEINAPFQIDGLAASVIVFRTGTGIVVYGAFASNLIADSTGGALRRFASGAPVGLAAGSHLQGLGVLNPGNFANNQTGLAGFQLPASKGGGFGWIRYDILDRDHDGHPDEVQAIDWAYNNAGGGINAGQTSAVPEPSTNALALLALGSAGVLAWRRRRVEARG